MNRDQDIRYLHGTEPEERLPADSAGSARERAERLIRGAVESSAGNGEQADDCTAVILFVE